MYIFKNALVSIWRNKGRNVLISIIFIVIATSCTIALAINNSATHLIDSYEESYKTTATISINRQNFIGNFNPEENNMDEIRDNFQNIESLTKDDILTYGTSKYVDSYYYTETIGVNADIEKATSETPTEVTSNGRNPGGMKEPTSSTDFSLIGYSSLDALSEFLSGTYTITEGAISLDDNSCIINEELALVNDLSVGDTITFISPNDEDITYELKITGIYTDSSTDTSNRMDLFSNSANNIITSTDVTTQILTLDDELVSQVNPTFVLTSSSDVKNFEDDLLELGMSENYTINTNLDEVEQATSSISNIKTFAITFLVITLIIGAIILLILNMINVRERKYEIGVLRTIGMKKSLVSLQFILELLVIAFISIIIGLGIGSTLSIPTANYLLEQEIDNTTSVKEEIGKNFGDDSRGERPNDNFNIQGVANIEKIDSINAVVNIKVIIELLAVGLMLTIISSSVATVAITRFTPLTILKERS